MRSPARPSQSSGICPGPPLAVQRGPCRREHRLRPRADDDVRSLLHRDRPLGRLPKRDAGDAEDGRLLLDAAGVRQRERRTREEAEEVEVAERRQTWIPGVVEEPPRPKRLDPSRRPRVEGEDDWDLARDLRDGLEESARMRSSSTFSGRCSVSRAYGRRRARAARRFRGTRRVGGAKKGVDHGVPDEFDALVRDPLGDEVVARVAARREEEGRQVIAEAAVDLLRHEEVVAAEAGLDVGDRVVLLRGDEGAGERRVDVADDDHDVPGRSGGAQARRRHDPRRLLGVRSRADAEVGVRLRQPELREEDVRELGVVVLAGVEEGTRKPLRPRAPRAGERPS